MRHICPYCKNDLGDLDHIMDVLAQHKKDGVHYFESRCCNQKIKAYGETLKYYIVAAEPLPGPQMIGAA